MPASPGIAARAELAGCLGGGLNIAHEAVERHAHGWLRERIAFRFLGESSLRDVGYGELSRLTSRFANVLRTLARRGERVRADRAHPELYIAALGGLEGGLRGVAAVLRLRPEPIATRIGIGEGAVLVTTDLLYERKVGSCAIVWRPYATCRWWVRRVARPPSPAPETLRR